MIIFNYVSMCIIYGTTFLAIKVGMDAGAPPFFSAGIRFFLAGLILLTWLTCRGKVSWSLLLRKEMMLTGLGLTFGTFSTLYWAEQFVTSGIAAILSATGPIMILLIQTYLLHTKASRKALWGCFIGLVGVIFLVSPNISFEINLLWISSCLLIMLGQLFYASGAIYSKIVIQRFTDTSPIALNAAQMMHGGAMLFVLSLITEWSTINFRTILTTEGIGSILYLTVAGSMMGSTFFYWLVAKTNPVFPATWLYISPLLALGLGTYLYGEEVTYVTLLGVITIIVGIILVNVDTLRQLIRNPKEKLLT